MVKSKLADASNSPLHPEKVNRKYNLLDNNNTHHPENFSQFQLKDVFKNPKTNEYGQFVQLDPYPSNKQVCDAKAILRNSITLTEQKLNKKHRNLKWIIHPITQDDNGQDIGVVGYCVEMV